MKTILNLKQYVILLVAAFATTLVWIAMILLFKLQVWDM